VSTTPPSSPIPSAGGPPGGPDADPPPIETLTQYDAQKDAYHCSYGPVRPARTVWDPEREVQVRLDETSNQVIGFSIPNFTAWHKSHADADGSFDIDLPSFWPGDTGGSGAS
jgi:hypothetical protein